MKFNFLLLILVILNSCNGSTHVSKEDYQKIVGNPIYQKLPFKKEFNLIIKNEPVSLIFNINKFNPNMHDIEYNKSGYVVAIDGIYPLGTDGGLPKVCIESIQLTWANKKVEVPKNIYQHCYQPNFVRDRLIFNSNDESILYYLEGSDGAGNYSIYWIFRKNGNHLIYDELDPYNEM